MASCRVWLAHPPRDTLTVQAPANDTVSWAAGPTYSACCSSCKKIGVSVAHDGPPGSMQTVLPATSGWEDDTNWSVVSTTDSPTQCFGLTNVQPGCEQNLTLTCNSVSPGAAQGNVNVTGREEAICYSHEGIREGACPSGFPGATICDGGTVSVTINGQTASAQLSCASTRVSVAFQLAQAIDRNATLGSVLISANNGSIAYVSALNTGTQYDYQWTTNVSCANRAAEWYGHCSFAATLSPAASLASPPQPQ